MHNAFLLSESHMCHQCDGRHPQSRCNRFQYRRLCPTNIACAGGLFHGRFPMQRAVVGGVSLSSARSEIPLPSRHGSNTRRKTTVCTASVSHCWTCRLIVASKTCVGSRIPISSNASYRSKATKKTVPVGSHTSIDSAPALLFRVLRSLLTIRLVSCKSPENVTESPAPKVISFIGGRVITIPVCELRSVR